MKLALQKGDPCPFQKNGICIFDGDLCPLSGHKDIKVITNHNEVCIITNQITFEITATPVKSEFEQLLDEMIDAMDYIAHEQPDVVTSSVMIKEIKDKMAAFAEAHGL